MAKPLYQLRFYEASDYEMIEEWFDGHGRNVPPEQLLPRLGAVCLKDGEDVAAMWLYMDNSVGLCTAEFAISKPKLPVFVAKQALMHLLTYFKNVAGTNDYGIMRVITTKPVAKILSKMGFTKDGDDLIAMSIPTKEEK